MGPVPASETSSVAKASQVGRYGVGVLPSSLGCVSSSTSMAVAILIPKGRVWSGNIGMILCFFNVSLQLVCPAPN